MGCINNKRNIEKRYIIKPNQMTNIENRKKSSLATSEQVYSKKLYEENNMTNLLQNVESMIENNPLPFVKIKMKKHQI